MIKHLSKWLGDHFLKGFLIMIPLLTLCACTPSHKRDAAQLDQLQKQLMDINKKLDAVYHRVSVIQFMVDSHEREIKNLEHAPSAKQGENHSKAAHPLSDSGTSVDANRTSALITSNSVTEEPVLPVRSARDLYHQALAEYNHNDYDKANNNFRALLKKFPHDNLADNALYWAGECLYAQKQYRKAINTFKQVTIDYPQGGKVPDALLKIGYSYISLGDKANARLLLKKVIKQYPFSPSAQKAEKMLNRIQ